MKIIESGPNWLIQDNIDINLLSEVNEFLKNNLKFLVKGKKGYSTKGHNAEQYWIKKSGRNLIYNVSEYDNLEKKIKKEVYERLKKASLLKKFENSYVDIVNQSAWTVIGEEGSYHVVHNHSQGEMITISSVLYLNVPEKLEENEENDNSIFLILHANPSSSFTNNPIPDIHHIYPEIGTILIFAGHINHGTYPQTKGIRQTFNLDYKFDFISKSCFNYT